MNDGSFVLPIPLDDALVEPMLDDGMLELELAVRPALAPPDALAVVFEPLP